jgi:hypothetical protein
MGAGSIAKDVWERRAPSVAAVEDAASANSDG